MKINGEKLFWFGAAGMCIVTALSLLLMGPAKGEETLAGATVTKDGPIYIYEFTPSTARGIQCVYVDSPHGGGMFCWPKMMNTEVQKWIEKMDRDRKWP